jgi:hypothetical protein
MKVRKKLEYKYFFRIIAFYFSIYKIIINFYFSLFIYENNYFYNYQIIFK